MSQPAISNAIADLERALGVRLLDRSRQEVSPPRTGARTRQAGRRRIRRTAARGLESIAALVRSDRRRSGLEQQSLSPPPSLCLSLTASHSNIREWLFTSLPATRRCTSNWRSAMSSLSCPEYPIRVAGEHSAEILFHDTLVVAVGAGSPLTRRRKIALADLLAEPGTLFPADSYFGTLQAGAFPPTASSLPRATVVDRIPKLAQRIARDRTLSDGAHWVLAQAPPAPDARGPAGGIIQDPNASRDHHLEEWVAEPARATVHRASARCDKAARQRLMSSATLLMFAAQRRGRSTIAARRTWARPTTPSSWRGIVC